MKTHLKWIAGVYLLLPPPLWSQDNVLFSSPAFNPIMSGPAIPEYLKLPELPNQETEEDDIIKVLYRRAGLTPTSFTPHARLSPDQVLLYVSASGTRFTIPAIKQLGNRFSSGNRQRQQDRGEESGAAASSQGTEYQGQARSATPQIVAAADAEQPPELLSNPVTVAAEERSRAIPQEAAASQIETDDEDEMPSDIPDNFDQYAEEKMVISRQTVPTALLSETFQAVWHALVRGDVELLYQSENSTTYIVRVVIDGRVYEGVIKDSRTGLDPDPQFSEAQAKMRRRQLQNEVKLLKRFVKKDHIAELMAITTDPETAEPLAILLPYYICDFHSLLGKIRGYTLDEIADERLEQYQGLLRHLDKHLPSLLLGIVQAIALVHSKNYAHLDISTENLLIESLSGGKFNIRLTDFGRSRKFGSMIYNPETRMALHSPDVLDNMSRRVKFPVDATIDYWALGRTLHFIASSREFTHFVRKVSDWKDISATKMLTKIISVSEDILRDLSDSSIVSYLSSASLEQLVSDMESRVEPLYSASINDQVLMMAYFLNTRREEPVNFDLVVHYFELLERISR